MFDKIKVQPIEVSCSSLYWMCIAKITCRWQTQIRFLFLIQLCSFAQKVEFSHVSVGLRKLSDVSFDIYWYVITSNSVSS